MKNLLQINSSIFSSGRNFLGFLGITDIEFVYAEGLNMGEASKDTALAEAKQRLAALAA